MFQDNNTNIKENHHCQDAIDDLARIFNTAVVTVKTPPERNFPSELNEILQSPVFKSILYAVRDLSIKSGISEREASEQLIQTFRKLDSIWSDYLHHEGLERVLSG